MSKITPFLWFNGNAEEAINHYTKIFKNTNVVSISRYPDGSPMPAGTVMSATMTIEGQTVHLLNAGPQFTFTPAISFMVNCENQEEVDYLWDSLCEGGKESQCGWLEDKFGLSWQIIPTALGKYLGDSNREKAGKAMQAMLKMKKIIIADLEAAFNS